MADITVRRHHGNAASRDANLLSSAVHVRDKEAIYALLRSTPSGLTSKEIGFTLNKPLNTFSGRISQLKADGKVRGTGRRRNGAEVIVVTL
jgi:hypothetical protein